MNEVEIYNKIVTILDNNVTERGYGCVGIAQDQTDKVADELTALVMNNFVLDPVSGMFTLEEVEDLLQTQRTNCMVAVMKHVIDEDILGKINNAPIHEFKKK